MNYKIKKKIVGDVIIQSSNGNQETIVTNNYISLITLDSIFDTNGCAQILSKINEGVLELSLDGEVLSNSEALLSIEAIVSRFNNKDNYENKIINNLTDDDNVNALIKSYYIKEEDGKQYFRRKRAELAYKLFSGVLTEEEVMFIESKVQYVKFELLTGDWISALYELNQTVTESVYTQAMKDEYKGDIEAYIALNY